MKQLTLIAALVLLGACDTGNKGPSTTSDGTKTTTPDASVAERDAWQKPIELLDFLGGVRGQLVADLFAGDGYMSFKLVQAGASVIAIDTDRAALDRIEARKKELKISDEQLTTRLTKPGDPGLGMAEVDKAFMVDQYRNIQDRVGFAKLVKQGLKFTGQFIIVDWEQQETPIGPPLEQRFAPTQIMDDLERAGYTDLASKSKTLPYQYIMIAQDYLPEEMVP